MVLCMFDFKFTLAMATFCRSGDEAVVEMMFRPVKDEAVDLNDFAVWSAETSGGNPTWIKLLANGNAAEDTYHLEVVHGGPGPKSSTARTDFVARELKQQEWIRVVMRHAGVDGQIDRQLADRGQAIAWADMAGGDGTLHLVDDLAVEGHPALEVELDPDRHRCLRSSILSQ